MKIFLKAVLAGLAIGVGGVIYLSLENRVAGSFLFSIGLFTIYTFGLNLYTGKVCSILYEKPRYLWDVLIVYLGNFVGAGGFGYLLRFTKLSKLSAHAVEMTLPKIADSLLSAFIMAVLCGLLMSIAVIGFQTVQDSVGKHFALVLPVMVFILSGYEHSIADIFYFSIANVWSTRTFVCLLVISLGNLVGGNILPFSNKYLQQAKPSH